MIFEETLKNGEGFLIETFFEVWKHLIDEVQIPRPKTNMTTETEPWTKMYFLLF